MDIYIECVDCEELFKLTEKEQDFYKSKGFVFPKRCKACRERRREDRYSVRTSSYFENAQVFGPGVSVEGGISIEHEYCVKVKDKGYAYIDDNGKLQFSDNDKHLTYWDAARKIADTIELLGMEYTNESESFYSHLRP